MRQRQCASEKAPLPKKETQWQACVYLGSAGGRARRVEAELFRVKRLRVERVHALAQRVLRRERRPHAHLPNADTRRIE
eukprot:5728816-Pleurochrysis_carterae.AAC.1